MRGGTSKAVFLRPEVLPGPGSTRDRVIMGIFGSGDPRQIDGLGGADVLTSKVAIVGPSERADADVDYTFGQVGIGEAIIDWFGNCGNISSAVGVFAIEEGLVTPVEPLTTVSIYNTNTNLLLRSTVPVRNGVPEVEGDFQISGVPGSGAEIKIDFSETVGTLNGRLLPSGSRRDLITLPGLNLELEVSIVDVAKPAAFFRLEDIGLTGAESLEVFTDKVLATFHAVQLAASELLQLDPAMGLPRPVGVGQPRDFVPYGRSDHIEASEVDLLGRWVVVPPPTLHKAFAGTGAVCTGVAARLAGTVVSEVSSDTGPSVRIGHPSGVFPVTVDVDGMNVKEASFSRTARRLMQGNVYLK
jgi:2-methylaconitate cis-trans-isomerase PrpF